MKIVLLLLAMVFAFAFAFKKVADDVRNIAVQQELKLYAANPNAPDVVEAAVTRI